MTIDQALAAADAELTRQAEAFATWVESGFVTDGVATTVIDGHIDVAALVRVILATSPPETIPVYEAGKAEPARFVQKHPKD